jgi:hypothetical protein
MDVLAGTTAGAEPRRSCSTRPPSARGWGSNPSPISAICWSGLPPTRHGGNQNCCRSDGETHTRPLDQHRRDDQGTRPMASLALRLPGREGGACIVRLLGKRGRASRFRLMFGDVLSVPLFLPAAEGAQPSPATAQAKWRTARRRPHRLPGLRGNRPGGWYGRDPARPT